MPLMMRSLPQSSENVRPASVHDMERGRPPPREYTSKSILARESSGSRCLWATDHAKHPPPSSLWAGDAESGCALDHLATSFIEPSRAESRAAPFETAFNMDEIGEPLLLDRTPENTCRCNRTRHEPFQVGVGEKLQCTKDAKAVGTYPPPENDSPDQPYRALTTKSHLARAEPASEPLELSSSRTRAELELSRFRPGPRPLQHLSVWSVPRSFIPDHTGARSHH